MSRLDDEIVARRQDLDRDPTNLETASRFWKFLSDNGVGNGRYVVEAFRAAALEGKAGVVALAHAYRELFNMSGEPPRAESLDAKLVDGLKSALPELSDPDRSAVEWVLTSIG